MSLPIGAWRLMQASISATEVSTVFVGVDLRAGETDTPLLFETIVFFNGLDSQFARYPTWEAGHEAMVKKFLR